MAKYVGAIILTLAATLFGLEKSSSAKKELSSLAELCAFFTLLSRRIRDRRESLSKICTESADAFAKKLVCSGFEWEKALEELKLSDIVRDRVLRISKELGGVCVASELVLCADAAEYLANEHEALQKSLCAKLPLYRSLWLIAGLSAVIILM